MCDWLPVALLAHSAQYLAVYDQAGDVQKYPNGLLLHITIHNEWLEFLQRDIYDT